MTDLALPPPDLALAERLRAAAESASGYMDDAWAENTRKAYAQTLRAWAVWCDATGLDHGVTPHKVALYVASLADAGKKRATVDRAVAGLAWNWRHGDGNVEALTADPVLARTLRGIRRKLGSAQKRARPVTPDELRRMVQAVGRMRLDPLRALQHRALLVLAYVGALRVSEALALEWDDVRVTDRGLEVTIRRSKTDQQGVGTVKALPRGSHPLSCPVTLWSDLAEQTPPGVPNRIFTASPRTVHDLVRRTAELAGVDGWQQVSTHSLRAGLATSAAMAGKPLDSIMRQTGHRSVAMVLRYVRPADLWRDNAAAGIGL